MKRLRSKKTGYVFGFDEHMYNSGAYELIGEEAPVAGPVKEAQEPPRRRTRKKKEPVPPPPVPEELTVSDFFDELDR